MGVTLISPTAPHGGLNWDTNLETNLTALASAINTASSFGPADLNTYFTASGAYRGSGLTNAPLGSSASFMVVVYYGGTSSAQVAYGLTGSVTGGVWTRTNNGSGWTPWAQVGGDSGWAFGSNFSLASGWSTLVDPNGVGSGSGLAGGIRLVGKQLELRFRVNRTGSTLTADSSGNLTDTLVCTVNTAAYQPTSAIYDNFYVIGVRQGTVRLGTDGTVTITDMVPNGTISTGDTVQVGIRGFVD